MGEHASAVTSNGVFRPVMLVEGRAAGTWRITGGSVQLEPLAPLACRTEALLADEAAHVRRFLGGGSFGLGPKGNARLRPLGLTSVFN